MQIRANLDETVHVRGDEFTWQPSPMPGVERMMLDRDGDEVAVATSIVRYAPGSYFEPHEHALGEEFLVLDGVFSDEHGDYPAGTYIRNPPGTAHKPHSEPGCIIFVKLRQFDLADQTPLTVDVNEYGDGQNEVFRHDGEVVSIVRVPAGERFAFPASVHVRELLILQGELTWQQEVTHTLSDWSGIRMSPGDPLRIVATTDCTLFSKTRPVYPRES
jgi:quercetin dioxygenase-like cupin family protein